MKHSTNSAKPKVYSMSLARIYPLLVAKVERKGRSQAEVDEVINWLTGYDQSQLKTMQASDIDYETFFKKAPALNPKRKSITGVICGVRVEEITEPIMQEIRYLDKLIDDLAKGKQLPY